MNQKVEATPDIRVSAGFFTILYALFRTRALGREINLGIHWESSPSVSVEPPRVSRAYCPYSFNESTPVAGLDISASQC